MKAKYYSVLGDTSIDKMNPVAIIRITYSGDEMTNEYRHKDIPWTENNDYVARHIFVDTTDGTVGDIEPVTALEIKEIESSWV